VSDYWHICTQKNYSMLVGGWSSNYCSFPTCLAH